MNWSPRPGPEVVEVRVVGEIIRRVRGPLFALTLVVACPLWIVHASSPVALARQTPGERADVLVAAIQAALERPVTDAGRRVAAAKLAELDRMGSEVLTQKCAGYNRLVSLNRGSSDPDEKLLRRFLALYDQLPQAQRAPFRFGRYLVYEILAADAHRHNDADLETRLLRDAVRIFTADPGDARERQLVQQLLDRAEMVGRPAPPLIGGTWLNLAPGTTRMDLGGAVTVIEFTAHWCSPCKDSYPGLLRLHERFGPQGLRIVLATRLWGYLGKEKNMSPERELAAVRRLFIEEDRLPFPIVIADAQAGAGQGEAADANAAAYFVQPIPHFVVIDRHGMVRRVDLGWEAGDEARLTEIVKRLLAER